MNVYKCPFCSKEFKADSGGNFSCPSCGREVRVEALTKVPWDKEEQGRWIDAFWNTLKNSFVDPISFFKDVGEGRGVTRPLIYAIIINLVNVIFAAIYQIGFNALAVAPEVSDFFAGIAGLFGFFLTIALALIFIPIGLVITFIIQSAIFHLGLKIVGGAKKDFSSTFRIVCYATGPNIFGIIPFVGIVAAGIWVFVLDIIGLKVVNDTSYARSAIAVSLPIILCCGLIFLFVSALFGATIAAIFAKGMS